MIISVVAVVLLTFSSIGMKADVAKLEIALSEKSLLIAIQCEKIEQQKKHIINLIQWTKGGNCNDCDMIKSHTTFLHEEDCGHLETINAALKSIGREEIKGYTK
jgi:hypothetical protein